jgi:hypothetical protein
LVEAPSPDPLPRGTTEARLTFRFDGAVSGFESALRIDGPGSLRVESTDDGTAWTAVLAELYNGARTELTLAAGSLGGDCGSTPDSDLTIAIDVDAARWDFVGSTIARTPPPASPPFPWFREWEAEQTGLTESRPDARAMLVDLDGDGHDDLVTIPVVQEPMRPRLLHNRAGDGGFGFVDRTADSGLADQSLTLAVFGDLDNDGDQDLVALTGYRSPDGTTGVWTNDGSGRFSFAGPNGLASPLVATGVYKEPAAAALADFDLDGDLDLYIGHWYAGRRDAEGGLSNSIPLDDELYENDGSGSFTPRELPEQLNPLTATANDLLGNPYAPGTLNIMGRAAYGLAVGDVDDDGDPDLFVHNYGAGRPALGSPPRYWDHNLLWINDGRMNFEDVAVAKGVAATRRGTVVEDEAPLQLQGIDFPGPIGGNGFGCQFADVDNDLDLDLISATIAHPDYPQSDRTLLWINQGRDVPFDEQSLARGLEYAEDEIHPAMVDVDHDGRLDLVMSRLRQTKLEAYRQTEAGTYVRLDYAESGVDITRPGPTLWTDLDRDGDLDFVMPKGAGRVFENLAADGRPSIKLTLHGGAPRDATGARVVLTTPGGSQLREVVAGQGHYNSQPSRTLVFGLDGYEAASSIEVRWPDGTRTELGPVRAGVWLRLHPQQTPELIAGPD